MQAHQAEVQAHEAEVTAYEQEMQAYRDAYGEQEVGYLLSNSDTTSMRR